MMCRLRIQKLKIGLLADFEKKSFSSLFLMRKPLSSDQKWFLRPYFPLIGGIFVLKSGLRFLFRALEVPKPRVRKSHFFPATSGREAASPATYPNEFEELYKNSNEEKIYTKHP